MKYSDHRFFSLNPNLEDGRRTAVCEMSTIACDFSEYGMILVAILTCTSIKIGPGNAGPTSHADSIG
jgi:hypothetical protein